METNASIITSSLTTNATSKRQSSVVLFITETERLGGR